jgi:hypothetical protein
MVDADPLWGCGMIVFAAGLASVMAADAPTKTSIYLRCQVQQPGTTAKHPLDIVYFSQPPKPTLSYNTRDPDHLLPTAMPIVGNGWPSGLVVFYGAIRSATSEPVGTIAIVRAAPGNNRATIRLDSSAGTYTGDCDVTEGAAAEQQFLGLLK